MRRNRKYAPCFSLIVILVCGLESVSKETDGRRETDARAPRVGSVYLVPERITLPDGTRVEYERATLFVPLIRSRADSATIAVEFCRFRNETQRQGIPPVFKLHGGPGFPGLREPDQRYLENNVWPITRELGADYVVIGQRGIGSSKPNTLLGPIGGFAADQPVSRQEFAEAIRQACQAGRVFWESKGFDLQGFNVVEAAADVRDACRVLGYERIIVSGTSFGSHWAMAVMRYHPQIVARAVLSGMEGPDQSWDIPSHVLSALRRIAEEAQADDRIAAEPGGDDLIGLLADVLDRIHNHPIIEVVTDETGHEQRVLLDARAVRGRVLAGMGSRHGIRDWPARLLTWHSGEFSQTAKSHLANTAPLHGLTASFFLMDCGSGVSDRRRTLIDEDPAITLVGRINDAYRAAETVWNVDLGESFREGFATDVPTLVVNGTWDVNTPLENAAELVPGFRHSKFVTVERGSHAALREAKSLSPSFAGLLREFMRTGDFSGIPQKITLPPVEWTPPDNGFGG